MSIKPAITLALLLPMTAIADDRLYPYMNSIRAEVSCQHLQYTGNKLPMPGERKQALTPAIEKAWYEYIDPDTDKTVRKWVTQSTNTRRGIAAYTSCAWA